MIKLTQALLFASLLYVNTAAWAQGTVKLKGAILESACAISPDNVYQTIELGTIPLKMLERDGISQAYPFKIKLINCLFSDDVSHGGKSIEVTFIGFGNKSSEALSDSGVSLMVRDGNGHMITPGIPVSDIKIHKGEMMLKYSVYLVANGKQVISGKYHATINILVSYR